MYNTGLKNPRRKKAVNSLIVRDKSLRFVVWIFRALFIIGLCYLFLFPLFYLIVAAIQDPNAAKDPTVVWIPKDFSLENFKTAFTMLNFVPSITLTVVNSVFSTLAMLVSCSMVGYGFARFRFWESKIAFALVILIIIVPPQTIVLSNYLNFRFFDFLGILKLTSLVTGKDSVNLLGTPWTSILPSIFACGYRAGIFIFIFRQFFAGQPKELEEAARIDGCSAFGTFRRIMAPLAVPAFITVLLFSFIWQWNESYNAGMFYPDAVKPLAVQLNTLRDTFMRDTSSTHYSPTMIRGTMAAGSLMSILPTLLLYIFTQKYFTESIERSGIVG